VKYRGNSEVISALNGNWIKVVQRVGVPVEITPSIKLDLQGGSYLLLSDGKIWSDGKGISCARLKKLAPYLFNGQPKSLLASNCKPKE
jgi:hypothetical protein